MKSTIITALLAAACSLCSAAPTAPANAAAASDAPPLKTAGKQVFDRWCAACHAPGPRSPGTASLAAKYDGRIPAALEARDDLNPAMVRYFVRHGILTMPSFRKTEITDAELDALAAYLGHTAPR